MKNCEEMVQSLLKRNALYEVQRKNRIQKMVLSVGCMGVCGMLFWQNKHLIEYVSKKEESPLQQEVIQTNTEVKEYESQNDEMYQIVDVNGEVVVDGEKYVQISCDASGYTLDQYLGLASIYEGTYQSNFDDLEPKLYRVKESEDILVILIKVNGEVVLRKE